MSFVPGLLSFASGLSQGFDKEREQRRQEEEDRRRREQEDFQRQLQIQELINRPEYQAVGLEPNPLTTDDLAAGRTQAAQTPPDMAGAMQIPGYPYMVRNVPKASDDALSRYRTAQKNADAKKAAVEQERARQLAFAELQRNGVIDRDMEFSTEMDYVEMYEKHLSAEAIADRQREDDLRQQQAVERKAKLAEVEQGKKADASTMAYDLANQGKGYTEISAALGAAGFGQYMSGQQIQDAISDVAKTNDLLKGDSAKVETDWIKAEGRRLDWPAEDFATTYSKAKAIQSDLGGASDSFQQYIVIQLATNGRNRTALIQKIYGDSYNQAKARGMPEAEAIAFAKERAKEAEDYLKNAGKGPQRRDSRAYNLEYEPVGGY